LECGEVTLEHASALVVGTRHVASEEARAEVEARVLPSAASCSPSTFRKHVDAAVCAVDAADEARRHARAKGERQVWGRRIGNGLGELHVIDEWPVVNAMHEKITGKAAHLQRERRAQWRAAAESDPENTTAEPLDDGWEDRTLDNCRADALSDLVLRDDDELAIGSPPHSDEAEGQRGEGSPRQRRPRRPLPGRTVEHREQRTAVHGLPRHQDHPRRPRPPHRHATPTHHPHTTRHRRRPALLTEPGCNQPTRSGREQRRNRDWARFEQVGFVRHHERAAWSA
jgi:hypothetical protein